MVSQNVKMHDSRCSVDAISQGSPAAVPSESVDVRDSSAHEAQSPLDTTMPGTPVPKDATLCTTMQATEPAHAHDGAQSRPRIPKLRWPLCGSSKGDDGGSSPRGIAEANKNKTSSEHTASTWPPSSPQASRVLTKEEILRAEYRSAFGDRLCILVDLLIAAVFLPLLAWIVAITVTPRDFAENRMEAAAIIMASCVVTLLVLALVSVLTWRYWNEPEVCINTSVR